MSLSRSEREQLNSDRDMLMKKLVEVEMDGQAAAKQVAALRDSMQRLRQVRPDTLYTFTYYVKSLFFIDHCNCDLFFP